MARQAEQNVWVQIGFYVHLQDMEAKDFTQKAAVVGGLKQVEISRVAKISRP